MSPEMNNNEVYGPKTDIWSLAIAIAYWIGLIDICPNNMSAQKFTIECISSEKHDYLMGINDICITPSLKDLLVNMLEND